MSLLQPTGGASPTHVHVHVADDCSALMRASRSGHADVVQALLQGGAPVDERNQFGYSALHIAAGCGHASCVSQLLSNSADHLTPATAGWSALSLAAYYNHVNTLRTLLREATWTSSLLWAALAVAAKHQRHECAAMLRDNSSSCAASHAPPTRVADGLRLHLSNRSDTGYRGVYATVGESLMPEGFKAQYNHNYLGNYDTAVEAAVAYAQHVGEAPDVAAEAEGVSLHLSGRNTTGYLNVNRRRKTDRFTASYWEDDEKQLISLGSFPTAVEAAVAYASAVGDAPDEAAGAGERAVARAVGRRAEAVTTPPGDAPRPTESEGVRLHLAGASGNSSGYKGVSFHKSGWLAKRGRGGRGKQENERLGIFETPVAAAVAYARSVLRDKPALAAEKNGVPLLLSGQTSDTGYKYVRESSSGCFVARMPVNGRMTTVGQFDTAIDAALAVAQQIDDVASAPGGATEAAEGVQTHSPRRLRKRRFTGAIHGAAQQEVDMTTREHAPYAGSICCCPADGTTLTESTLVTVYYLGHGWCPGALTSDAVVGEGAIEVKFETDNEQVRLENASYGKDKMWVLPTNGTGWGPEWLLEVAALYSRDIL